MSSIVTLPPQLLWSQIREMYSGEWVELSDVDWPVDTATPKRARVRNSAEDRNLLIKKVGSKIRSRGSVILFIGFAESVVSFDLTGVAA